MLRLSTVEVTLHAIRFREANALRRNMIPHISNLILAIPVRVDDAVCPRECERAPDGANAAEAGILEAVPLAGRHVAA